ncbi:hypothetical protein [Chryseobacterium sediminis]|uniref:Uncharacterized protein n=1 Tax=Chryseobacterium sediminis TaxID=1679494 RepID=A0A5B2U946_9FLAO|nr:hypothetical protein [Chryseobacterium sediminis]KAA2223062.1 hypothetical protein FW780_02320 [Chryseobacterium sediminis]
MTHEFTSEDWEEIKGGYKLEFEINLEDKQDKPIVQVYQYMDTDVAVLNAYPTIITHIVTVHSSGKFSGYVVIK